MVHLPNRWCTLSRCSLPCPQGLSDPASRGTLSRWLQGALPVSSRLLGNAFYTLAVLLNLLGCLWVAIAKWEGLDNSWMVNVCEWGREA